MKNCPCSIGRLLPSSCFRAANSSAFQTHSAFKFCGFAVFSRSAWRSWRNFFPHKKNRLKVFRISHQIVSAFCIEWPPSLLTVNIEENYGDLINRPTCTRLSEFSCHVNLPSCWLVISKKEKKSVRISRIVSFILHLISIARNRRPFRLI